MRIKFYMMAYEEKSFEETQDIKAFASLEQAQKEKQEMIEHMLNCDYQIDEECGSIVNMSKDDDEYFSIWIYEQELEITQENIIEP